MFPGKMLRKLYLILFLLSFLLFYSCERPENITAVDDGLPPAVPQGLFVYYASEGDIDIEWQRNNEPDLLHYNIYRRTNKGNYTQVASTENYYYFDDSLDYAETYFYKVTAVDKSGLESNFSEEISAQPINRYKPNRPNDFEVFGRNWNGRRYFFLKWMQNKESDIAYYNVYKSTTENFTPDNTNLIDTTTFSTYEDTTVTELYIKYFYKISAVDKGGMVSSPSFESDDMILDVPQLLFPANNSRTRFFDFFKIISLAQPANYKIILQSNEFYGEIWSKDFSSNLINDTLEIDLNYTYFEYNTKYFWRIVTYTKSSSQPNSITDLYSFTLIP